MLQAALSTDTCIDFHIHFFFLNTQSWYTHIIHMYTHVFIVLHCMHTECSGRKEAVHNNIT